MGSLCVKFIVSSSPAASSCCSDGCEASNNTIQCRMGDGDCLEKSYHVDRYPLSIAHNTDNTMHTTHKVKYRCVHLTFSPLVRISPAPNQIAKMEFLCNNGSNVCVNGVCSGSVCLLNISMLNHVSVLLILMKTIQKRYEIRHGLDLCL